MNRNTFKEDIIKFKGNKGARFCNYFNLVSFNWCCAFVSFCMREVAHINSFPKTASCSALKGLMVSHVNHDYRTAEVGDIILFETINPADGPDHVGIVIENNVLEKTLTLIEGNTANNDHSKSCVNTYTYPYNYSEFDCIIDMSSYFTDEISIDACDSGYEELLEKIKKIKEILATIK